jgi:hypothetical protein
MRFADLIEINPIFQSSINVYFDLNNEKKIDEYIPTPEACAILHSYINSIISSAQSYRKMRASVLYGPYGKGKSFLLLVLLYLVSADARSDTYQNLLKEIKDVDENCYSAILEMNSQEKRLLPIIINSDYDNLDQAILVGISESLSREGLELLIPTSTNDVAISVLDQWEKNSSLTKEIITACFPSSNISIPDLRRGLKSNDESSLKTFSALYTYISGGMPFNPLIKKDSSSSVKTVVNALKESYCGVFIVFDEFSKFLESGASGLSQQLGTLQQLFESATRSSDGSQIHICCVNHRKLSSYNSNENLNKIPSFRTVEGRVKEIGFTRSLGENYWLIGKAIQKKKGFEKYWEDYSVRHSERFLWFLDRGFVEEEQSKDLFKGCYPLNPLATYSLIQLSEMIAQNERTLFTFIADNDSNSLCSFLRNEINENTYGVDALYDYFSPLLEKEDDDKLHEIWFKSETILNKVSNRNERRIVKALAVSLLIKKSVIASG